MTAPHPHPMNALDDPTSAYSDAEWQRVAAVLHLPPQDTLYNVSVSATDLLAGAVSKQFTIQVTAFRVTSLTLTPAPPGFVRLGTAPREFYVDYAAAGIPRGGRTITIEIRVDDEDAFLFQSFTINLPGPGTAQGRVSFWLENQAGEIVGANGNSELGQASIFAQARILDRFYARSSNLTVFAEF